MIFKHVPPLNGLTSLVMAIGCTIDGVTKTFLLVPISTYMKLGGFVFEIRRSCLICLQLQLETLFIGAN